MPMRILTGVTPIVFSKVDLLFMILAKLLSLTPHDMNAYYNRAVVYNIDKQFDLAIVDFNKVLAHNPKDD